MKISQVSSRVAPASVKPGATPSRATAAVQPLAAPSVVPPRPASVSAVSWELLAIHVDDAQRRSAIAYTPLRVVVQTVVREMRASSETWESIYATLHSIVIPVPGRPVSWATEFEMHTSRSAALVAHMHSWADVERLAELEREEHKG